MKIKQSENVIERVNITIQRNKVIAKKLREEKDAIKKTADLILKQDMEKKKQVDKIVVTGNKTVTNVTAQEEVAKVDERTQRKIEEYERYLVEKRKADNEVIKKMSTVMIEQLNKPVVKDVTITKKAQIEVEDVVKSIEKRSKEEFEVMKEIVSKWRNGKTEKVVQDFIQEKVEIIERQLDIKEKAAE